MVASCPFLKWPGRDISSRVTRGSTIIERQPAVRPPVGALPVQGCRPAQPPPRRRARPRPWYSPMDRLRISAMLRLCLRVIAVAVMLVGLLTAQAADTTLTLACKGTVTVNQLRPLREDGKPEPFSMGMTVNLAARTVQASVQSIRMK